MSEKLKNENTEDKDAVFQSAANILLHIFDEDTEIIASIIKARGNYDVDRMCRYLNIVISYLTVCRTNLLRYGREENNV